MYPSKKLSEVWEIITWITPSKAKPEFWWWDTLFVKPPNLWTDKVVLESEETLSELWRREWKLIKKDSIMVCCIWSLWKIGIAGVDLCTNQQINSIYFNPELVLFKYWYYFCTTLESTLKRLANKAVVQIINKSTFSKIEILLPPLYTQSRIVARLDSAFASIDEQISLLRANIADVENMGKSSLDIVFQNNSEQKIPLWNLLQIKHWYAFSGEWFAESGNFLLLTPWNFSKQDWLILREKKEKYFIGDFPKEFLLKKWSLLIAMTDLSSSAPILWAPWFVTQDNMLHNQRLWLIENLSESLSENYLYYFFQSNIYRSKVKLTATGTTVRHTAPKRIYEIQIPLPSLPRQHEIVAHLDRVFAGTEALRAEYEAHIRDLETLRQSLLEEAFAGRLVQENEA